MEEPTGDKAKELPSQTVKDGFEADGQNATGAGNTNSAEIKMSKEGTVTYGWEKMVLHLTSTSLKLQSTTDMPVNKAQKQSDKAIEIPWQNVITAEITKKAPRETQKMNFTIHYIQQQEKKLQQQSIHLTTLDEPADSFIKVIQEQCAKVEGRPKKLFVLVNTIGGAGKGVQIYHKQVAPVLQLANINVDVVFTDHFRHAREIGEDQDLSAYDGVVVLGGDGLYQELLDGMTRRMQKSAGVDYNDMNSELVSLNQPIGIIPTGSSNFLSYWTNDIHDVETATLRVLLGQIKRSQVYTMYCNAKLIGVGGAIFACGFMADALLQSEKLRWMKLYRYPAILTYYRIKGMKRHNYILEYCLAPDSETPESTRLTSSSNEDSSASCRWIRHDSKGRPYTGLFGCIGNPVKKGDHYVADISSNCIRLNVVLDSDVITLYKWALDHLSPQSAESPPQTIDVIDNVQRIRIKLNGQEVEKEESLKGATAKEKKRDYYVAIDGETPKLEVPELEIRFIPSFVPLYSRSVE